jgi:hypothetical protein
MRDEQNVMESIFLLVQLISFLKGGECMLEREYSL